jgi:hypothetical protein
MSHTEIVRSKEPIRLFKSNFLAKLRLKPPSGRVVAFELHNTRI